MDSRIRVVISHNLGRGASRILCQILAAAGVLILLPRSAQALERFSLWSRIYGHPNALYRHCCEGCKSGRHHNRRLWFCATESRGQRRRLPACRRNRHCCSRSERAELALGRVDGPVHSQTFRHREQSEGPMTALKPQTRACQAPHVSGHRANPVLLCRCERGRRIQSLLKRCSP